MALNPGSAQYSPAIADIVERIGARARESGMWQLCHYAPGDPLFDQGEPDRALWLVQRGLVSLTYLREDGTSRVKSFVADCGLFTGSGGFEVGAPNLYTAHCLEAASVAMVPLEWVQSAVANDPDLGNAFLQFLVLLQARKQKREHGLLCFTAEERYRDFLRDEPALAERLRQTEIAEYLGLTPVALSRIRRRLGLATARPPARAHHTIRLSKSSIVTVAKPTALSEMP